MASRRGFGHAKGRARVTLRSIGDWLLYLLCRVFISIVQAVSLDTCQTVIYGLAYILYDVVGLRRGIVDENLSHSLPQHSLAERQEIARGMWRHLLLMVCEIAHAPRKIHVTNWNDFCSRTPLHGEFVKSLLLPRPILLVTAHFGNFEVAGYLTGMLGFKSHTVARTLDNPYLDRYINRFRESQGQFILPKVGSAPQADAVLASGGLLGLLGDQHAGDRGCWVDFLGRPASCHKAIALFSLLSGAPMIVSHLKRTGKPLHYEMAMLGIFDPADPGEIGADVASVTQWYNDLLGAEILRAPEQYWWLHNRWRASSKKKGRKQAAARKSAASVASKAPAESATLAVQEQRPQEQRPAA
jgi:KDO2-lipid IV(A) lauroyltransferase